ncbi:class I SAM-dependent methyltransferase [Paenibacillus glufosinatiresistens]|uniref:class I SAM-dependent methyltransferase n=1 Tax=Paenibacillus glufosinatiresistens TaxID=3070657 RepID=UPI00286DE3AA|nr:methyltransferase domain-containing protein [Paenibacillus sp. YX.27]
MNAVTEYYERYNEADRLTGTNTGRLEFMTTTHLLDRHLDPGASILELGAGAGIYSLYYGARGCRVTATDLSPKHVEQMVSRIAASGLEGRISAEQADATNLSRYESESYDAVLCLGPMYHLTETEDRRRCAEEALRVLKPGGVLAVAYINRSFIFPYLVKESTSYLTESWMARIAEEGKIRSADEDCFWTDAYFHTPEEMERMFADGKTVMLAHAAADGVGMMMEEVIDGLDAAQFEVWSRYHLKTCEEPSLLGISNHALYLGRKI